VWSAGRYEEALPRLLDYLDKPYGRNVEGYYMIGTSACRIPERRALGARCLDRLLQRYDLDAGSRRRVKQEMHRCHSTERPLEVAFVAIPPVTKGNNPASVSSKMFHWLDQENVGLAHDEAKVVRAVDPHELASRLFEPGEVDAAREKIASLAGTRYEVVDRAPFVLASASHSPQELAAVGDELVRVADFFVTRFSMPPPEHLIGVYLTSSVNELRRLALQMHGIDITDSSIGYSYRDDMSLLGVVPGRLTGTLKHELFHLMVRSEFGDIPPWLDEGMAALYEVSGFEDGELHGRPNWRGPVLERHWELRPHIGELVEADWPTFHAGGNGRHLSPERLYKQAANHATARYFVLYLQEQGKLEVVYQAMQTLPPLPEAGDGKTGRQILEEMLEQPIEEVDQSFADWFNAQVARNHLAEKEVRRYQER
jgi:hypothetical protein